MDNINIDTNLVQQLISEQFPQWQSLPIYPVAQSGWDNRTFHLGKEMVIRMPSDKRYEPQIEKEHQWLPWLSKQLSFQITQPIALGKPSSSYPWHWSINRWIEGESASKQNTHNIKCFAESLGKCLKEFQSLDATGGPLAGAHNFYRGGSLNAYDHEMQLAIPNIKNSHEQSLAASLWQEALSSEWRLSPVWVHGDIALGNILVLNGKLHAIIDFGQLAIGDPACDLVIAWNFFSSEEREVFKDAVQLDKDTWMRALGWALWKTLCWPIKGTDIQKILHEIYTDYNALKTCRKSAMIKVREYKKEDAKALASIYFHTNHTINSRDYTEDQVNVWAPEKSQGTKEWMKKWEKTPPLVAVCNEQPVGFAEFESTGHIDCFYVHHQYQGEGIGSLLMQSIFSEARKQDIHRIFAEVSITARPFFELKGFKVVKQQTIVRKGIELQNFVMERNF